MDFSTQYNILPTILLSTRRNGQLVTIEDYKRDSEYFKDYPSKQDVTTFYANLLTNNDLRSNIIYTIVADENGIHLETREIK